MSARFPTLPDEHPADFIEPEREPICNRCRMRPCENEDTGLCRYCTTDTRGRDPS